MAVVKFDGQERGCGYPQVGGLYLISGGLSAPCDRLPMIIPKCPVCGETVRFSRSMQQIDPYKLFGDHENCKDDFKPCPACQTSHFFKEGEPAGLMWAGDAFYTPDEFVKEANKMGISKRIAVMPNFFEVGKTWLFVAHKKAVRDLSDAGMSKGKKGKLQFNEPILRPGIIVVVKPSGIRKVMKESDITEEKIKDYEEKGIDILQVPDDDDRFTSGAKSRHKKVHPLAHLAGE